MNVGDKIVWIHSTRDAILKTGVVTALAHQEEGELTYVYTNVDNLDQVLCDFVYKKFCYPIEREAELLKAVKAISRATKALEKANRLLYAIPKQ